MAWGWMDILIHGKSVVWSMASVMVISMAYEHIIWLDNNNWYIISELVFESFCVILIMNLISKSASGLGVWEAGALGDPLPIRSLRLNKQPASAAAPAGDLEIETNTKLRTLKQW
jgi:hypothetical protein